ncbi:MAG: GTP-binding protein [Burkholderiales bacterium]|jgi:G3E family GTPase|nr:GTP-binding protein [Burkholderiales bacterium]
MTTRPPPVFAMIPVTILTGFLGVGKTTLLNTLLRENHGEKIAIIENEFGEINLDTRLLTQNAEVEIIELTNGCVCCTVRGELTASLQNLLERRDAGALAFDRLILETTGLADPAPIIQTFFVDEILRERFQLDAVIALVDSEHAQKQLNEHRVAASQIGFADRLLLTKVDRLPLTGINDDDKALLIDRLRKINARAPIIEVVHGQLSHKDWLGLHAFNLESTLSLDEAYIAPNASAPAFIPIRQPRSLLNRSWNDNIASHIFEAGEMNLVRVGAWMESLIEAHGNDMLRYKGILAIAGEPRRLIVQGVHKVVGFDYGEPWRSKEPRRSVLVVIGRELPLDAMKNGFMAAQSAQFN